METQVFPSKVDTWIGVLLAAGPVVGLVGAGAALTAGSGVAALLPLVLMGGIYRGLVFPIRYELREEGLFIRFGLARSLIPYATIRGVKPTRNPLSSPALSLDRLHIQAGSALGPNISPKDRDGFLDALVARAPHLVRVGEELRPA